MGAALTTSVAVRIRDQNCSPFTIHGCDTAQLRPALLKLSAMVPQGFHAITSLLNSVDSLSSWAE